MRRALLAVLLFACDNGLLSPDAPAWQRIATDGVPPRWGQVAIYDARRDRLVLFGGDGLAKSDEANLHGETSQRNDLWALDLGTLGWQQLPASAGPGPRTDLAGVLDPSRDRFVIMGGRVGFAASIDEVWAYSFQTATWAQLSSGPRARHDVPSTTDGAHMWVFGGAGNLLQSLDDLWQLDFATDTWTELPDDGVRPSARTSGALAYLDGVLYLSGGHDAVAVQGDSWRYELAQSRWTKIATPNSPIGGAHFGYAMDQACGTLWMSAGDNLDNYDVAFTEGLDTKSSRFKYLTTSNLPPPRDHPSMIFDPTRRRLVLYGGGTLGDGLGVLGDTWILPVAACP